MYLLLLFTPDAYAAYGGAVSVNFGVSAGLQQLSVSFASVALHNNVFANCIVTVSVFGGNSYGGAVSLHIGAYSSVHSQTAGSGDAVAAVGDTVVRNLSVSLDTARFESCEAIRERNGSTSFGANVYGGSFSFHVGSYAWSKSETSGRRSKSTCGSTNASGISVRFQNILSFNARASTKTSKTARSYGANSYGGSMSLMHVGAYSWSWSNAASSNSTCGATAANEVSVHVSGSACSNCSALSTTSGGGSYGANSYGGSMSLMHVGAYSWSRGNDVYSNSSSTCEATAANEVSVHVSDSACSNCSASNTKSGGGSYGANSYGGSLSMMHVGAYSWSRSYSASSNSMCEATAANEVSVHVSGSACFNCSALSTTSDGSKSDGANSYGGSMSMMHVGAYSWSLGAATGSSFSTCGATAANEVSVHVSDSACSNCSASNTKSGGVSYGANSYGGAISAALFGAYSYSFLIGSFGQSSRARVDITNVSRLTMTIKDAAFFDVQSFSGEMH